MARADAGRLELRKEEFDLGELLAGVLDDAQALADPLDLTVEAEIPRPLPLRADRVFVGIIAQNLIENAVKYNAPGGIIRVSAQAFNGTIEMTVANTGEGIPAARSRIFSKGSTVRAATNACQVMALV